VCPAQTSLHRFYGALSILILRLNQETRAPRLHMHGADHTWRHPTSRSSNHRLPDMCLTIINPLHQVSYSYLDSHRYLSCHTCHLHTTRQVNVILHTNKGNSVEPRKCTGFKFKPRHVNDSSQTDQGIDHLVSHTTSRMSDIRWRVWICVCIRWRSMS
jgi:hypothetical protein